MSTLSETLADGSIVQSTRTQVHSRHRRPHVPFQQLQQMQQQAMAAEPLKPGEEPKGLFPLPIQHDPINDPALTSQPSYDDNSIQILNDTAADDSEPSVHNFLAISEMGKKMKKRIDVRASVFLSKNQVFSNIIDNRDFLMAQDDFEYSKILSEADANSIDLSSEYYTAASIIEAGFNIRLRRSRKALNLSMFNTVRQESVLAQAPAPEERKIWQKIPFLGNRGGQ